MDKIIKQSSVDWIISESVDSEKVKWIPIFEIEFNKRYHRVFGLTSDGFWMNEIIMEDRKQISVVYNKSEYIGIITVLEKDRTYVEKLLIEGLSRNTAGNYTINIFPFVDLIKYALEFGSGYWSGLAISWLRQEDFDNAFCDLSNEIVSKKKLDQKSRHKLFKLQKRFERLQKRFERNEIS